MKGGISVNAAVINKNAKLQRVPEACADTNWSRNTLMKVAAEANAIIRVGRTVRIDMPVLSPECQYLLLSYILLLFCRSNLIPTAIEKDCLSTDFINVSDLWFNRQVTHSSDFAFINCCLRYSTAASKSPL